MESKETQRIALEIGRIASWETDFSTGTRRWSEQALAMLGVEAPGGIGRIGGPDDELLRLMHPDDRSKLAAYHESFRTHDEISADYRIIRPDGSLRYLAGRGRVVQRAADGSALRVINIVADITERRLAEIRVEERSAELEIARDRYRVLIEATAAIQWTAMPSGEVIEDSLSWRGATGQSYEEFRGAGWLDALHPDDRAHAAEAWQAATATGDVYEVEYRLRLTNGDYVWTVARGVARRDKSGKIVEWIGINEDISERKGREEQARVIMRELTHRTKNLLAVIQSIARRTFAHSDAQASQAFSDRLQGLAVSHDLLVRGNWRGVSLRDLVVSHLDAFAAGGSAALAEGPELLLRPEVAQNIGMAIHELATNASKYGALSTNGGRLRVSWDVTGDGEKTVSIRWDERPNVAPGDGSSGGFGRLLLDRLVPQAVGGIAKYDVGEQQITWRLDAPFRSICISAPG